MKDYELKAYRELFEKKREGRDTQIHLIVQEIKRLQGEIDRHNNRDLINEIYVQYEIPEKKISLQEFRKGILGITSQLR